MLGLVNVAFASKQFDINDKDPPDMGEYQRLIHAGIFSIDESKHQVTFFPHKSEWSKYYIVIAGTFESLKVGRTVPRQTGRTVGTPLFLEFKNKRSSPVTVTFDKEEYDAGEGIILSPNEVVSGIMLLDERPRWTLHTPWTCQGVPLSGSTPKSTLLSV